MTLQHSTSIAGIAMALLVLCAALCLTARAAGAAFFDNAVIAFSTPLNASGASWQIRLFDLRTQSSIPLWSYHGRVPAQLVWSPDGQQIAASLLDSGDIILLDVYQRSHHSVVAEDGFRSFPAWSPDGTQILFHENNNPFDMQPNTHIYRVDRDGSNRRQLTDEAAMYPAWSPDGTRVLYSTYLGGDLYVMTRDGDERSLLIETETRNTHPIWSPDGQQIAFLGFSTSGEMGDRIYVVSSDGSHVFRLASNTKMEGRPVWSPDGQQIAFVGQLNGDHYDSLFVADLHGGLRRLVDHVEYAYDVLWDMWSPDGRYIAFEPSNGDGLSIVEVASGTVTRLTNVRSSYPAWRP